MSPIQFTIDAIDQDIRLDVFLTRVTGQTRSQIQKRIKNGATTINGTVEKVPHRFLEAGDIVKIRRQTRPVEGASSMAPLPPLDDASRPQPLREPIELNILFEDNDILVLNKPAGVLVHPTDASDGPTLMDAAIAHDPKIATVGDDPRHRAGIVHRLDRMVSGVMVVAKTPEAFASLKQQWQDRTVEKRYRALVNGQLDKTHDTIVFRMVRSPQAGRMVARPESQEGKDARTDYTVTVRYANATEVDIVLHTGRMHQIRAHFHALGHPVVGDLLYTIRNQKRFPLNRLWLHSYRLAFSHPITGDRVTFDAPVPDELTTFTNTLHRLV